jgi:hypothetical protein
MYATSFARCTQPISEEVKIPAGAVAAALGFAKASSCRSLYFSLELSFTAVAITFTTRKDIGERDVAVASCWRTHLIQETGPRVQKSCKGNRERVV